MTQHSIRETEGWLVLHLEIYKYEERANLFPSDKSKNVVLSKLHLNIKQILNKKNCVYDVLKIDNYIKQYVVIPCKIDQ